MLYQILAYLRNWFVLQNGKYYGKYSIEGGVLSGALPPLQNGQYIRIIGSVLNDGVYQFNGEGLPMKDETFQGAVWLLAVPAEVVALADEIQEWTSKNSEVADSPYQSESFGGYSYSLKGDVSWCSVFAKRLNVWRKV